MDQNCDLVGAVRISSRKIFSKCVPKRRIRKYALISDLIKDLPDHSLSTENTATSSTKSLNRQNSDQIIGSPLTAQRENPEWKVSPGKSVDVHAPARNVGLVRILDYIESQTMETDNHPAAPPVNIDLSLRLGSLNHENPRPAESRDFRYAPDSRSTSARPVGSSHHRDTAMLRDPW